MANKFEISTIFKAVDQMTAPISRMQSRVRGLVTSTQRGLAGLNATAGKFAAAVGLAGVLSVGALTGAMSKATAAGIDFEQTMVSTGVKVHGMILKGTKEFDALQQAAMTAGATTEFTAQQAAEALKFLAMAGFDAKSSVAALPGVIDLATAAETDLAQATDIATDALGAFSMVTNDPVQLAKNLQRVSDVMSMTANTANTDMQMLFETLKKGGPVATAAGMSLETVAAQAGIMANSGIKAELAGTAIANSYLNLSNPTGQAAKVVRRLGIQLKQHNGALKDLPDLIDEVNKKTRNLTKTQRQAAVEALFGREGLAGNIAVLNAGGDAIRKYRKELEGATGSAHKAAGIMRTTTRGSINSLRSAIEAVSIRAFGMTGGPLKEAVDLTTKWVRANGDLIATGIGNFFLTLAKNLDAIVFALKGLAVALPILWAVNTALKVMAVIAAMNPIVLIVGALVAVAAAVILNWDKVKEHLLDSWAAIEAAWSNLWDNVRNMFNNVMTIIQTEWDGFLNRWISRINSVSNLFGQGNVLDPIIRHQIEQPADGWVGDVPPPTYPVSSPQDRMASTLQETKATNTTEVVIRDETTHSTVTTDGKASGLKVSKTGGF